MVRRRTPLRRALDVATVSLALCAAAPDASAQATPPDPPAPHHVEIELTLLNVGISGAGHVGARWYVGGGGSLFPAASINTFTGYPIELAEAHGFVRWAPASAIQVDAGVRGAYFQYFRLCVFDPCTAQYGTLVGPYADVHVGFRQFKVGPRFAYVRREDGVWGATLYPLILRIQFS